MEKTFNPNLRFYKRLSNNKKWSKPLTEEEERKQKLEEIKRKQDLLHKNQNMTEHEKLKEICDKIEYSLYKN